MNMIIHASHEWFDWPPAWLHGIDGRIVLGHVPPAGITVESAKVGVDDLEQPAGRTLNLLGFALTDCLA